MTREVARTLLAINHPNARKGLLCIILVATRGFGRYGAFPESGAVIFMPVAAGYRCTRFLLCFVAAPELGVAHLAGIDVRVT